MVAVISYDELRARLRDPALTLVDVLPHDSFEAGHLPGAVNLPLDELESRAPAVIPHRGADIVVYCSKPT